MRPDVVVVAATSKHKRYSDLDVQLTDIDYLAARVVVLVLSRS
jgi:hypothetical protein